MFRHKFLGSTDLSVVTSLLKTYNVPTKITDRIKLHKIKQQDDLILVELGTLLTSQECDEIIYKISKQTFEPMSNKYDIQVRNNSRLVIMDDRLARTLWRRLKFSNKLPKLIPNTKPLGFNVQGEWEMSGVNGAMRLNKYTKDNFFAPHKDAQYAPNGDERSLFSLIIYLNDNYEKGETKFYFPKRSPNSDIKGLTIKEEIEAYGGLDYGYECITIKPKKGYAILFTHNLLHEAIPPELPDSLSSPERMVLRTDVLVKRKDKPLGFAVCPEEEEDYLACLNFFREAQQCELKAHKNYLNIGQLYERSLSIRYCYPRLLEIKRHRSIINNNKQKVLINELPSEIWLHIFKFLHEQDIQHLIFAYPEFQLLKIIREAQEIKNIEKNPSKHKFIPKIQTQYGSRTLFRFSDANFFNQHIHECCRVAAVYAFFLLGHGEDSTTYTVRYNKYTQEVCEIEMERLLTDTLYNRNCYGSLYRVEQKNENKRQPKIDFDDSVDRTYMINRHQSQFIGQDLLSRFHCKITDQDSSSKSGSDSEMEDESLNEQDIRAYQRKQALEDREEVLVENIDNDDGNTGINYAKDDILGYREQLIKQVDQNSGTSICRILSGEDHVIDDLCICSSGPVYNFGLMNDLIRVYNHLIFDFDTHQLTVERLPDKKTHHSDSSSFFHRCIQSVQRSGLTKNPISYYRVNIEKLAEGTKGFNHASCHCEFPSINVDQFSFLDYTYLSHIHFLLFQTPIMYLF